MTLAIHELLAQLEASLADARLSDDEKRRLSQSLREAQLPEEGLRRLRNQAFELARQALEANDEAAQPASLVRWLEGVMRTLDVARGGVAQHRAYFSPGPDCLDAIRSQLAGCRERADICVFTISDDRISEAVLGAHQRGVQVRIITDNDKTEDRGSDIDALRSAGVAVREDGTDAHMHHKFAIFDGRWLVNGSYNWTRSASAFNEENIVVSNEPVLTQQFGRAFERLWSRLA